MEINENMETLENVVEASTEATETVKEAAEQAWGFVAGLDASTIVKIGVVGGIVGAAASTFAFKPIANKVAKLRDSAREAKSAMEAKLTDRERAAKLKKLEKLQKELGELEESKEKISE